MRVTSASAFAILMLAAGARALAAQEPAAQGAAGQARPAQPACRIPAQDPAFGAVPQGDPSPQVMALSLEDALERALKYNLAQWLGAEGVRSAEGARRMARSRLLPNLAAAFSETQNQVNLKAMGFGGFPGVPTVVGPFSVFDGRLYLSQSILDLEALRTAHAAREQERAAELSYRSVRERVVFLCGDLYLQAAAGSSRIEAARAQANTARTLYDLAVDLKKTGVVPGIEVVRAQVELQAQQQRLIVAQNEFETQKLNLAHAIGLPLGQQFRLTDDLHYVAFTPMTLEQAVERAYRERPDYQAALAQVRAAEFARKAAAAQRLPVLRATGNYGINGPAPGESHGSYSVAASLRIPIFEGGQAQARILEADAALRQRQAEAEELRARIHYEVRTAFLNLQAAEESVKVATGSVALAREQLDQAQDRFSAGVASNIEVVQAQEALAGATEVYISSLYAHGIAKGRLAQVLGVAESSFLQFLRGN